MKDYPALRNILRSLFSVQTGLDDESAQQAFARARGVDVKLRSELATAFDDPDLSWKEMLCNEEYEVFEADSEVEARNYAAEILTPNRGNQPQ